MEIKIETLSLTLSFKNAILEVDSLKQFLDSSLKSIKNDEYDFKLKYKNGIIIADALDSIFKEKGLEKQKQRLEEINNIKINDQICIKDILNIILSEDDIKDGVLSKISYVILNQNTYKNNNPKIVRKKEAMFDSQKRLLSQSILSSIVTLFEAYLSEIYELLIISNHSEYLSNKQINISQIFNVSIKDIIHNTVQHEVEQGMYDSLATLDSLKEKSKVNIDRYCPIRKKFEEIYYRRNIYIHNKGFVNEKYISKVDSSVCNNIKIGEYAECSEEYLYRAIRLLKIVISTLYYELLNTQICEDKKTYYALSEVGFEALCNEEYDIAEHIYNMLRNQKTFEFIDKATYQVNYLNALKQQGKNYKKELSEFDVSIATDNFKIAKLCLEDNFEEVYKMLQKSYPNSFNAEALREWPLFIDFRKTDFYKEFKENHISDFNEFVFEDSQQSENSLSNCEEEIDNIEGAMVP